MSSVLIACCPCFSDPGAKTLSTAQSWRHRQNMYPKVKVRAQREEADQYAYEKSSLQSLKAFEWLSPQHISSSEQANKKKTVTEESPKKARATSAHGRVPSYQVQGRKEEHSGLKNGGPYQNRRPQCKIFPKSSAAESFTPAPGHNKESAEPKDDTLAKGGMEGADSSMRTGPRKKITPSSVHKLLGKLTWN
ncbi:hypothetical protein Sango_0602800 [Sesamum angolense]|uniref:Uncharacterized protein n=1 Tax=Sesamum angolense TaxID=2727404 RepID=A0AAE2C1W0_9LAMI|nr:hypothetical protein Sango_0602800 [Sesamum angolense]